MVLALVGYPPCYAGSGEDIEQRPRVMLDASKPSETESVRRNATMSDAHRLKPSFPPAKLIPIDPSDLQPPPVFPERRRSKSNTLTNPARESLPTILRWKQALWRFQARLKEPDIKYATKVGLGTGRESLFDKPPRTWTYESQILVILAVPAFTDRWRDTFLEFRGEWALIAFWATMNPSIGGTNLLSFYRVAGTL